MSIELVISQSGPVTIVGLIGDLDLAAAPVARSQLLAAIHEADSPPLVVVDLLGVDFLDAIGIGVLFAGVVVCRSRGGDLAICRAEPQVAAVLRLTRVDEILPLHPDPGKAAEVITAAASNEPVDS